MIKEDRKIICIAGATASGKSSMAFKKNLEVNGKDFNGIISVDSRQIYKNIPIFAGISKKEKENFLVGFLNEWENFSAGSFMKMANKKIEEIFKAGKTPILVGGTSFYFKALLYENFLPKVDIDKKFRKNLEKKTADELIKILETKDFKRAQTIDKKNIPRIIRSLEIINFLGYFPETKEKIRDDLEIEFFWIDLEREKQKKNIKKNFLIRIENGFLEEAESLKKKIWARERRSSWLSLFFPQEIFFKIFLKKKIEKKIFDLGLAYKNIFKFWEGKISKEKFVELGILEEQKYAKRQNTYLKKFFENLPEEKKINKKYIDKK